MCWRQNFTAFITTIQLLNQVFYTNLIVNVVVTSEANLLYSVESMIVKLYLSLYVVSNMLEFYTVKCCSQMTFTDCLL